MNEQRARRLADRIQVIVAEMLERRIKDPRLGFVTVTDVRVTGDLREATVFYTVMGDQAEQEATAQALASATGLIRSEVGKQTGIKFTPTIAFVADAVPEKYPVPPSQLACVVSIMPSPRAPGRTFVIPGQSG